MNSEFEQDVWESFLKAAVIENSLNESDKYPTMDEINKLILPTHYDSKMRRFIKHYQMNQKVISLLKYGKKIASIALFVMGISFSILLQFHSVRAACRDVIISIYEKYIRYDYNTQSTTTPITINYIPDSFELVNSISDDKKIQITYQNDKNEQIKLTCYLKNRGVQMDNEHHTIIDIAINDTPAQFFQAKDSYANNYLIWNANENYFILSAKLDLDTMKKIAENIE